MCHRSAVAKRSKIHNNVACHLLCVAKIRRKKKQNNWLLDVNKVFNMNGHSPSWRLSQHTKPQSIFPRFAFYFRKKKNIFIKVQNIFGWLFGDNLLLLTHRVHTAFVTSNIIIDRPQIVWSDVCMLSKCRCVMPFCWALGPTFSRHCCCCCCCT